MVLSYTVQDVYCITSTFVFSLSVHVVHVTCWCTFLAFFLFLWHTQIYMMLSPIHLLSMNLSAKNKWYVDWSMTSPVNNHLFYLGQCPCCRTMWTSTRIRSLRNLASVIDWAYWQATVEPDNLSRWRVMISDHEDQRSWALQLLCDSDIERGDHVAYFLGSD